MKKLISVVLAFVMVLGCFSVTAFALQDRAAVEITVVPTATSYNKGDVVTFEVFYEGSVDASQLGQPVVMGFGFDSSVFETLEDVTAWKTLDKLVEPIFIYDGYEVANTEISEANSSVESMDGATEKDAAKGWDKYISFKITSQQKYQDYTEKKASFAFKLRVKEDADPNGSYTVGISDYIYTTEGIKINDPMGGVYGDDATVAEWGLASPHMFSFVDGTVNVASATVPSILTPMSSQIRFKGVASDGDFTNYGGTFDVRTRATIATDDFNAKFTDEATAKEKITEFGFVYKAESVGAFDYKTAKSFAQGASAEGYVKYTCHYMQRTADGYNFTCLIKNIPDADHNEVVNSIAYVCFNGEYIFFDDVATINYNTLYTTYKK